MRNDPYARLDDRIREWSVAVDRTEETGGALMAFGTRRNQPVVLKIQKESSDEWRAGEVLQAFGGIRTGRVFEHSHGAMLVERLSPATPLSDLCRSGEDDRASAILAELVKSLSPVGIPQGTPSVEHWGVSFHRFAASGGEVIPAALVQHAGQVYSGLCRSQSEPRLLHGDLHHDNVLFDATRDWIAVDPKGVVGELEFEIGAALRNPIGLPRTFTDAAVIDARVRIFSETLHLNAARMVSWGFAQAVLATIWLVEDGEPVTPNHPWLELARVLRERSGPD